jgi:hypothetical protein
MAAYVWMDDAGKDRPNFFHLTEIQVIEDRRRVRAIRYEDAKARWR